LLGCYVPLGYLTAQEIARLLAERLNEVKVYGPRICQGVDNLPQRSPAPCPHS
jgi:hypothetical protein